MKIPPRGFRARVLGTLLGFLAVTAAILPGSSDPDERSVWSGVYTTSQAERGRERFDTSCAMCHQADLAGRGPIPALRGAPFTDKRYGESVGDLYERMRTTMPPARPGTLGDEAYADIVAYVLSQNAYPPGDGELASHPESLHQIVFDDVPAGS